MSQSFRSDSFNIPPLWAVFALTFVGVLLIHSTLLRLPYYWDEAGYYIPAAIDFSRTGSLVPFSTLSNAHPPLPSIYLAACWKIFGFSPFITRTAMCLVATFALTAVWRLAFAVSRRVDIATLTLALTAIYPVFFVQSSLAHADMFAAAATLWALVFFLDGYRIWWAVVCFSLAALSKETAIATPIALAGFEIWLSFRARSLKHARIATTLLVPSVPLALWYAYHWHHTRFVFGNPQYLRYNATATLSLMRILVAFWHRSNQILLHMNMFVPVLLAFACLLLEPLNENTGASSLKVSREQKGILAVVIVSNAIFFSVLGGALLTRYLLPLYPLVILFCVITFRARFRQWRWFIGLTALAFVTGLFVNPPYRFTPEDNLAYRDMIHLQQNAISQIMRCYPGEQVLTAWPASDELTKPELGYVSHPVKVSAIDDFSFDQIQIAASSDKPYTVGLIFSTKYEPTKWALHLGRRNEQMDTRFFGFHHDLDPATVARLLGGNVVWREQIKGQWAAVLHFDRPQMAQLQEP